MLLHSPDSTCTKQSKLLVRTGPTGSCTHIHTESEQTRNHHTSQQSIGPCSDSDGRYELGDEHLWPVPLVYDATHRLNPIQPLAPPTPYWETTHQFPYMINLPLYPHTPLVSPTPRIQTYVLPPLPLLPPSPIGPHDPLTQSPENSPLPSKLSQSQYTK